MGAAAARTCSSVSSYMLASCSCGSRQELTSASRALGTINIGHWPGRQARDTWRPNMSLNFGQSQASVGIKSYTVAGVNQGRTEPRIEALSNEVTIIVLSSISS